MKKASMPLKISIVLLFIGFLAVIFVPKFSNIQTKVIMVMSQIDFSSIDISLECIGCNKFMYITKASVESNQSSNNNLPEEKITKPTNTIFDYFIFILVISAFIIIVVLRIRLRYMKYYKKNI